MTNNNGFYECKFCGRTLWLIKDYCSRVCRKMDEFVKHDREIGSPLCPECKMPCFDTVEGGRRCGTCGTACPVCPCPACTERLAKLAAEFA